MPQEAKMAVYGKYNRTLIDYDGEKGSHGFKTAEITAVNFAAQATLRGTYGTSVAGICNGVLGQSEYGNVDFTGNDPSPNKPDQREQKWLVRFTDNVNGKIGSIELPCADTAVLDPNNRGYAQMGDAGPVDAYVSALEAFALTIDGNALTVQSIKLVGRNV